MRGWDDVAQLGRVKSKVGMSVKASSENWHLSQLLKNTEELAKRRIFQAKWIAYAKDFMQEGTSLVIEMERKPVWMER